MSLYAAANIAHAVKSFGPRGYASLRGLIFNAKNFEGEEALVQKTADEIDTSILFHMPRDRHVQQAEGQGKTVVEAYPDSDMAKKYHELALLLLEGGNRHE